MAFLDPPLDIIKRQKVQPTPGELKLLEFLIGHLDDSFEIYYQPYVNGDNPDIIIMRKGSGILIIEIKDWNLKHYYVDAKTKWRLERDNTLIRSPLQQVEEYKSNLFNLHVEELYHKNIKDKNHWATVNCAVYFHNANRKEVEDFLLLEFASNSAEQDYHYYRKFVGYFGLMGRDSLTAVEFNNLLSRFWLNRPSRFFDDSLYNSCLRYFKAPMHQIEDGKTIKYSKEQEELIRSEVRPRRKIKGSAGSGKTLVLAKRAVNALKRVNSRILILTYNLSLKNYIHDRINDVREEFYWKDFYITNYHQFFKVQANNCNLEIQSLDSWQKVDFFEFVKDQTPRFDVILIDEIQDYKQEWIDLITEYFMHSETEFVVFGDEKQNIYDRILDENNEPIVRKIPGNWNKSLNTSYRFTSGIGNIAIKFQKSMFNQKYGLDELNFLSQIDFEKRVIEYHYFNYHNPKTLFNILFEVLNRNQIHPSDAGILCSKVELLRELDFLIRDLKHEKTTTMFESLEEFNIIKEKDEIKLQGRLLTDSELKFELSKLMHNKLEGIRKIKKNHFWMKTGTMKLSTVHSFKGWEIDTLILIIENEDTDRDFTNSELIYTGLTRARRNLIVFNLGNTLYHNFFKSEIETQFTIL